MDLIYTNSKKEELGVLKDYNFDLAFGADENNFQIKIDAVNHVCNEDFFVYYEDTEYGGIIDSIGSDTEKSTVTYKGRTWHGYLESHIIEPSFGDDYLTLSGEANNVIGNIISRLGIDDLFKASSANSGINISNYKMNRYIKACTGIRKMLKSVNAKLIFTFKNGFVELSASPIIDYTQQDEFDNDQISFVIQKNYNPINHVICLGKGDLKDRQVIHIYSDEFGNIGGMPSLKYLEENAEVYDYPNAESEEDLIEGGIEIIQDSINSSSIKFIFKSNKETFDINDVIGGQELITNTYVKTSISKKIVKFEKNTTKISYECQSDIGTVAKGGYLTNKESTSDLTIQIFPWFILSGDDNGDMYCDYANEVPDFAVENGKLYINNPRSNITSFDVEDTDIFVNGT